MPLALLNALDNFFAVVFDEVKALWFGVAPLVEFLLRINTSLFSISFNC